MLDALFCLSDPGDEVILTGMLDRGRPVGAVLRLVPLPVPERSWIWSCTALDRSVTVSLGARVPTRGPGWRLRHDTRSIRVAATTNIPGSGPRLSLRHPGGKRGAGPVTDADPDPEEPGVSGTRIVLAGSVLSTDCRPIPGALLDFWHADGGGAYDNTGFRLRGHQFADGQGRYRLETVVPGLYPGRTRHFHVRVQAPNQPALTTQLYFPDEPANRGDGIFRPELIVTVRDGESPKAATSTSSWRSRPRSRPADLEGNSRWATSRRSTARSR
jgi:protocatechuate 3,4-dioxygenase beta subunit